MPAIVALLRDDPLGARREREPDDAADALLSTSNATPSSCSLSANTRGEVVAALQLSFQPGLARAGRLRGQSVGRQLFAWAIDRARQEGATMLHLTSDASRTDTHRFYAERGFEQTHSGFKMPLCQPD